MTDSQAVSKLFAEHGERLQREQEAAEDGRAAIDDFVLATFRSFAEQLNRVQRESAEVVGPEDLHPRFVALSVTLFRGTPHEQRSALRVECSQRGEIRIGEVPEPRIDLSEDLQSVKTITRAQIDDKTTRFVRSLLAKV